jgi:hypothetical protein
MTAVQTVCYAAGSLVDSVLCVASASRALLAVLCRTSRVAASSTSSTSLNCAVATGRAFLLPPDIGVGVSILLPAAAAAELPVGTSVSGATTLPPGWVTTIGARISIITSGAGKGTQSTASNG